MLPLHAAAAGTLLAGVVLSLMLQRAVHTLEQTRSTYEFNRAQQVRLAMVQGGFNEAGEALRSIDLLFRSSETVSDEQFNRFTRPLIDTYPYLQALTYYRFIHHAERAAYEAERRRRWPGFEIREKISGSNGGFARARDRPLYLVLDMVAPRYQNTLAHGYDIWSYQPHRALAERSIEAGKEMASGLVSMVEPHGRPGIVIELPLYGPLSAGAGPAERRAAAVGMTEVLVDVGDLVQHTMRRASLRPGLEITLSARVDNQDRMQEVGRFGSLASGEPAFLGRLARAAFFDRTERFTVAGQPWELRARVREPAIAHLGSSLLLLGGLAFSIAGAAHVQGRTRRSALIESLVEQRTADLRRTSEGLRLHQRATESSANGIALADALTEGYPIIYINPAFQRMRGHGADELLGQPLDALARGADDQPGLHELRIAASERREAHALLHLRRKDGSPFHAEVYLSPVNDENGVTDHFVVSEYDVTEAKRYEAELEHRARHDTLTGLPNRVALADRIERALAYAQARAHSAWVVAFDLDHFKHVNDSLGNAVGDRLLRQIGERMLALVGPIDTVARIGDDEFVLLIANRADERQAAATVHGVLASIAVPFSEGGQRIFLTCSAGIAGYPGDGRDADSLVKHAQIAMFQAKESGRNTLRFYLPSMNERAMERLALVDAMRHAMSCNEFELHFQPQVDLASGDVVGMESLIRWRHPQMGMLPPDRFIALAEETGLIVPLGTWVLRTACAQAAAWQRRDLGALRVAVNLSSRQFKDAALPQLIGNILLECGLAASNLEIELTESLMMEDVDEAIGVMRELKAMGMHLSVDDFGTGYSSLSYLKRFPVGVLKIDQSFVRDIEHDANSASMVAAMISLSHDLGLRVIAEGVETAAQLDYLRTRGCDEVQGYFFSRPLPASDFERMVKDHRHALAQAPRRIRG